MKNIALDNLEQALLEGIADILDSDEVQTEEILNGISDPEPRETTELHIRMAKSALAEYVKTCVGKPDSDTSGGLHLACVNGWHLFSEQKPTEGDNIEVYYDDKLIVNVDWQDYLYNDKEFKHMRFWRACR